MDHDLAVRIDGARAQLGLVWGAARGLPVPFDELTAEDYDHNFRSSAELLAAWMSKRTTAIHCSTGPRARELVGTLHGGRIVMVQAERAPVLASDAGRPQRWYLVDLRLLEVEGHLGFTVDWCRVCWGPHRLKTSWVAAANTPHLTSKPGRPLDGYPPVEQAAFAEVIGNPRRGPASLPDLVIGLTRHRLEQHRQRWADHPEVLAYLPLLSAKRWFLPAEYGGPSRELAPAGPIFDDPNVRVAAWPPPPTGARP